MATLAARVSRIEGVIEQMNERLGNLEQGLRDLHSELTGEQRSLRTDIAEVQRSLRTEMRSNFRWTMGITIAMWVTIMGAVIGTLLAS